MKQVLLLEDDVSYAAVLIRQLSRHGYNTEHVISTDALLLKANHIQYDCILLDMNLGAESSLPYIAGIRAVQPQARILLVTGYASISTAVTAIKSGADDYIPKPITLPILLAAIENKAISNAIEVTSLSSPSPERLEWEYIQKTLDDNRGNVSATARQLNMHRRTLQRKLAKKPVAC